MLVRTSSTDAFARREAGGKGYNLYVMSRLGLPVPPWVVLGRSSFESFLQSSDSQADLQAALAAFAAGRQSAAEACAAIEGLILAAALPPALRADVEQACQAAAGDNGMFSVRSSAADEDSAAHSFAGQLSSFLYVAGLAEAERCLRLCWASNFSERALLYRRENHLRWDGVGVAVVFQRMVDPAVAGVLFTCDPAAKDLGAYVVSAVYGVGEGLVSGALDADTFWLAADSGALRKQALAVKTEAFRRERSGVCRREPVAPDRQRQPCLDSAALAELHRLGRALQAHYGRPQDVEWAWADGRMALLQTRPVTTRDENLTGFPNLWDNSNIVESYGGPTSPLSFTFALRNYRGVYIQFCELLGVPRSVIREMEHYLGNMLGCLNGRVYYNLYNWYKLVGVLPGFQHNRRFMETMMGVREQLSAEIADRIRPHPSWDSPRGRWRRCVTGLAFV